MIRGARIESAKRICGAHGAVMRRLLVAVALIATLSDASAGDFDLPILRGSEPVAPIGPVPPIGPMVSRWGGFFAGGQVGMGVANMDFSNATQSLVAHELRDLPWKMKTILRPGRCSARAIPAPRRTAASSATTIPGRCMIIGVDFNWSRINFSIDAPVSPISRSSAPRRTATVYATDDQRRRLDAHHRFRHAAGARRRRSWQRPALRWHRRRSRAGRCLPHRHLRPGTEIGADGNRPQVITPFSSPRPRPSPAP